MVVCGWSRSFRVAFTHVALYGLVVAGMVGCGSKSQPKPLPPPVEGVNETDEAKIKAFLDEAGLKGALMGIQDAGDHWLVEFQPTAVAPPGGGRPVPTAGVSYRVYKATGKVESALGQ